MLKRDFQQLVSGKSPEKIVREQARELWNFLAHMVREGEFLCVGPYLIYRRSSRLFSIFKLLPWARMLVESRTHTRGEEKIWYLKTRIEECREKIHLSVEGLTMEDDSETPIIYVGRRISPPHDPRSWLEESFPPHLLAKVKIEAVVDGKKFEPKDLKWEEV